jgi:hypothetical protein
MADILWILSCVSIDEAQCDNTHDNACHLAPPLLALANRKDPTCATQPKVAKASIIVTVACHCCCVFALKTLPDKLFHPFNSLTLVLFSI